MFVDVVSMEALARLRGQEPWWWRRAKCVAKLCGKREEGMLAPIGAAMLKAEGGRGEERWTAGARLKYDVRRQQVHCTTKQRQ